MTNAEAQYYKLLDTDQFNATKSYILNLLWVNVCQKPARTTTRNDKHALECNIISVTRSEKHHFLKLNLVLFPQKERTMKRVLNAYLTFKYLTYLPLQETNMLQCGQHSLTRLSIMYVDIQGRHTGKCNQSCPPVNNKHHG